MIVYPAIDIRAGSCVRLYQGDYERETVFDRDPVDAACRWAEAGAEWLHVVDLDGARDGALANAEAIERIRAAVQIPLQLGGGIRRLDDALRAWDLGIERVIVGTAAVEDDAFVTALVATAPDRVAIGIDARAGLVAIGGWLHQTTVSALDLGRRLGERGVRRVIYTDIDRDGTLQGPNLPALRAMIEATGSEVIASGGVGSIDDLARISASGAAGAIVGRALYDGRIELGQAIAVTAARVPATP